MTTTTVGPTLLADIEAEVAWATKNYERACAFPGCDDPACERLVRLRAAAVRLRSEMERTHERGLDVKPTWDAHGLPLCDDACPNYDGKRCRATGFRPDRFCEPMLQQQGEEMASLRGALLRLNGGPLK